MLTNRTDLDPVVTEREIREQVVLVSALWGSDGEAVTWPDPTTAVEIWNHASPKWAAEYRLNGGDWRQLGPRKLVRLEIDLQTDTLDLRCGENSIAPVSIIVRYEGAAAGVFDELGKSLVPEDGIVREVADFPALLALPSPVAGQRARTAAAVIPGGNPYIRWVYDGSMWRLDGPQELLVDFVPSTGLASAADQKLKEWAVSAGLLLSLRHFSVYMGAAKSGTTDGATVRTRLGTTGGSGDAVVASNGALSSANRQAVAETVLFASSATQVRAVYGSGASGRYGNPTTVAYPQNTAVSNLAAASVLSLWMQMSGSTDTPTMAHVLVTGY